MLCPNGGFRYHLIETLQVGTRALSYLGSPTLMRQIEWLGKGVGHPKPKPQAPKSPA